MLLLLLLLLPSIHQRIFAAAAAAAISIAVAKSIHRRTNHWLMLRITCRSLETKMPLLTATAGSRGKNEKALRKH
jgi:hypothetical protein